MTGKKTRRGVPRVDSRVGLARTPRPRRTTETDARFIDTARRLRAPQTTLEDPFVVCY